MSKDKPKIVIPPDGIGLGRTPFKRPARLVQPAKAPSPPRPTPPAPKPKE